MTEVFPERKAGPVPDRPRPRASPWSFALPWMSSRSMRHTAVAPRLREMARSKGSPMWSGSIFSQMSLRPSIFSASSVTSWAVPVATTD